MLPGNTTAGGAHALDVTAVPDAARQEPDPKPGRAHQSPRHQHHPEPIGAHHGLHTKQPGPNDDLHVVSGSDRRNRKLVPRPSQAAKPGILGRTECILRRRHGGIIDDRPGQQRRSESNRRHTHHVRPHRNDRSGQQWGGFSNVIRRSLGIRAREAEQPHHVNGRIGRKPVGVGHSERGKRRLRNNEESAAGRYRHSNSKPSGI